MCTTKGSPLTDCFSAGCGAGAMPGPCHEMSCLLDRVLPALQAAVHLRDQSGGGVAGTEMPKTGPARSAAPCRASADLAPSARAGAGSALHLPQD